MPNKMLIDATHPEETRVVVLRGNRVEEFDFESANRKQLRGNIYLAKVTRVEPSLQAAFVDYGGNRHGFLAFSEEEERAHRAAEADADNRNGRRWGRNRNRGAERPRDVVSSEPADQTVAGDQDPSSGAENFTADYPAPIEQSSDTTTEPAQQAPEFGAPISSEGAFVSGIPDHPITGDAPQEVVQTAPSPVEQFHSGASDTETPELPQTSAPSDSTDTANDETRADTEESFTASGADEFQGESSESPSIAGNGDSDADQDEDNGDHEEEIVETVGEGDALEEVPERSMRPRRQYKIQEVIKRRQVMLVQVVKEE